MSGRAVALTVGVALIVLNGCILLLIFFSPLLKTYGGLIFWGPVLGILWWATLIVGGAILLLLAIQALARRLANRVEQEI